MNILKKVIFGFMGSISFSQSIYAAEVCIACGNFSQLFMRSVPKRPWFRNLPSIKDPNMFYLPRDERHLVNTKYKDQLKQLDTTRLILRGLTGKLQFTFDYVQVGEVKFSMATRKYSFGDDALRQNYTEVSSSVASKIREYLIEGLLDPENELLSLDVYVDPFTPFELIIRDYQYGGFESPMDFYELGSQEFQKRLADGRIRFENTSTKPEQVLKKIQYRETPEYRLRQEISA